MGNKYNEQKELAWEVIHHLLKPGARRTFEDNLRVFSDWSKNWSKENDELLKKRKKLEDRRYDNIDKHQKRLVILRKKIKKLPESEGSRRDDLVRQIKNERNSYLKTRASLKDKYDQLRTPAPSPWELVRDIPERSRDEHNTNLTKFMFGDTPAPKTSSEQQFCRWYVRLSILRDKALPEEEPPIIAEGVLDPEEVEITWDSMQGGWDSWLPVIKFALEYVKTYLRLKKADLAPGTPKDEKTTKTPRKSKRKKKTPKVKWSRPVTKSTIITTLHLESVYKLNKLAEQGEYEIKQVGNNPQSWKIRIDKFDDNHQKKLR